MADAEIVEVGLAGGGMILARAEQTGSGSGAVDIGLGEVLSFGTVAEALRGVASELRGAIIAVKPDSAEVEFGLELALRGSRLACLLVDGGTAASIRIRLTWDGSRDGAVRPEKAEKEAGREDADGGAHARA